MTLLAQWTFFRDAQVFLMTLHILHVILNAKAVESPWIENCVIYETSAISSISIALFFNLCSILQGSTGFWSLMLDCIILPLGIVLQMISKPDSWFASMLWREGCDLTSASFFEFVFLTGEAMTFLVIPRFIIWTIETVRQLWLRIFVYLCLVGGSVLVAYGLEQVE